MIDERPLETLLTHTEQELKEAIASLKEPLPPGYAEAFRRRAKEVEALLELLECVSFNPSPRPVQLVSN